MEKKSTEKRTSLTPAEYWEWRNLITESWLAEERLKSALLEHKVLQRDSELLHIRTQLFQKTNIESKRAKLDIAKEGYEKFKNQLETSLGYSLNDKLIDDVTFEVKEAPVQPEK